MKININEFYRLSYCYHNVFKSLHIKNKSLNKTVDYVIHWNTKEPADQLLPISGDITYNRMIYSIKSFIYDYTSASFLDIISLLTGHKPRYLM